MAWTTSGQNSDPAARRVRQKPRIPPHPAVKRILIVDDFSSIRALIRAVVTVVGDFAVDEAGDGEIALRKLGEQRYDLVISDWNMPVMSGLELLQKMRGDPRLKGVAVVMLTAETTKENVAAAAALGISGYVAKPFSPEKLISVLRPLIQP